MNNMIPILRFDNVSFTYPGGCAALRNVSLSVMPGEKVGLIGLNGSGKSTLMFHTDALLLPDEGTVTVDSIPVTRKNAGMIRQRVGMVFQNSEDQLFMPTVEADVAFGPKNMGLSREEIALRVDQALEATGTSHLRHRPPGQLSGGQQKMVAVATVLSMRPSLLVMDEPTSGLDYESHYRLTGLIASLPHALLLSSHDLELIRNICSRTVVLKEGRVVYDGPVASMPYPETITLQNI